MKHEARPPSVLLIFVSQDGIDSYGGGTHSDSHQAVGKNPLALTPWAAPGHYKRHECSRFADTGVEIQVMNIQGPALALLIVLLLRPSLFKLLFKNLHCNVQKV
ncbi:hypothetical protein NDU88_005030 [Pleurodeles waltl]|uniref:Uncharacterized protein n=1 Tax=Pleurodeles waltl TaxID=8319 RepID=A0AAV7TT58_PLEWA|nr:hypothetical protein NDU88_005030 [Pleurodeles waltl]